MEITSYLNSEKQMLAGHNDPTHQMQLEFLLAMAEKFKGCSKEYATWKGMPDTKQIDALLRGV